MKYTQDHRSLLTLREKALYGNFCNTCSAGNLGTNLVLSIVAVYSGLERKLCIGTLATNLGHPLYGKFCYEFSSQFRYPYLIAVGYDVCTGQSQYTRAW